MRILRGFFLNGTSRHFHSSLSRERLGTQSPVTKPRRETSGAFHWLLADQELAHAHQHFARAELVVSPRLVVRPAWRTWPVWDVIVGPLSSFETDGSAKLFHASSDRSGSSARSGNPSALSIFSVVFGCPRMRNFAPLIRGASFSGTELGPAHYAARTGDVSPDLLPVQSLAFLPGFAGLFFSPSSCLVAELIISSEPVNCSKSGAGGLAIRSRSSEISLVMNNARCPT